jgi:membrane-associated phospholipid phosphatase
VAIGLGSGRPVRVAATVWGTLAVNYAVKRAVRRERPLDPRSATLVPAPGSSSFPSSHAAMSAAAAIVLCAARPRLAPVWVGMAAAMAWSRVYAGVHHAGDVVAGVAPGAVTGTVAAVV